MLSNVACKYWGQFVVLAIKSFQRTITLHLVLVSSNKLDRLKCFMWQMWHVMLMLRYGVGAGVNRVFSCCPGTLAGHTSRSLLRYPHTTIHLWPVLEAVFFGSKTESSHVYSQWREAKQNVTYQGQCFAICKCTQWRAVLDGITGLRVWVWCRTGGNYRRCWILGLGLRSP